MQEEFKTKITADITQYNRAFNEMKGKTSSVVDGMRMSLGALSTLGVGISIKSIAEQIIGSSGEMQQINTAFEVMTGSVKKAQQALGKLNKFADTTPFDTKEVINSGRALLNIGVAIDDLPSKLEVLGNIASGTGSKISEIVNIYAKSANKGKVQAEELMQLSERGIPIIEAFSATLGVKREEVYKLGEQGKLSFGLLEEALASMGGAGGKYFNLMAKQSQNMLGQWSNLKAEVERVAIAIGNELIPEISKSMQELLDHIAELKASGELDTMVEELGSCLRTLIKALQEVAVWLNENKQILMNVGYIAIAWGAWQKLHVAMLFTAKTLKSLKLAFSGVGAGANKSSLALRLATTDIKAMVKATGVLRASLSAVSLIGTTAFTGWEIGRTIAEMLKLEEVFTRMMLKGKVPKGSDPFQKVTASVQKVDLVDSQKRQSEIAKELTKLQSDANILDKSDQSDKSMPLKERIAKLTAESKAIDKSVADYKAKAQADIAKISQVDKEIRAIDTKIAEQEKILATPAKRTKMNKNSKGFVNYGAKVDKQKSDAAAKLKIEDLKKQKDLKQAVFYSLQETEDQYNANKKSFDSYSQSNAVANARADAEKLSAVEKFKLEQAQAAADAKLKQEQKNAEKQKALQEQIAKEREKVAKAKKLLAADNYRDKLSEQIDSWNKKLTQTQQECDKARNMLQKLGFGVNEPILKTKEQIEQAKKQNILNAKIEAHNRGEKVNFSAEEKEKIASYRQMQLQAKAKGNKANDIESKIAGLNNKSQQFENSQALLAKKEQAIALANKSKALNAASLQLNAAKEANKP